MSMRDQAMADQRLGPQQTFVGKAIAKGALKRLHLGGAGAGVLATRSTQWPGAGLTQIITRRRGRE